jgi:hypothetical protein
VSADLKFNLGEYTARLAGHGRGLRRLEARIVELNDPTAYEVAGLVRECSTRYRR